MHTENTIIECFVVGISFSLEEKQRATRRKRETEAEKAAATGGTPLVPYEALWFKKVKAEDSEGFEHLMHVYKGNYWNAKEKGDWKQFPDIFY